MGLVTTPMDWPGEGLTRSRCVLAQYAHGRPSAPEGPVLGMWLFLLPAPPAISCKSTPL
jgi:hypothetical protein